MTETWNWKLEDHSGWWWTIMIPIGTLTTHFLNECELHDLKFQFWNYETFSMNLLTCFTDSSKNTGFYVLDISKRYVCRREEACYLQAKWCVIIQNSNRVRFVHPVSGKPTGLVEKSLEDSIFKALFLFNFIGLRSSNAYIKQRRQHGAKELRGIMANRRLLPQPAMAAQPC